MDPDRGPGHRGVRGCRAGGARCRARFAVAGVEPTRAARPGGDARGDQPDETEAFAAGDGRFATSASASGTAGALLWLRRSAAAGRCARPGVGGLLGAGGRRSPVPGARRQRPRAGGHPAPARAAHRARARASSSKTGWACRYVVGAAFAYATTSGERSPSRRRRVAAVVSRPAR